MIKLHEVYARHSCLNRAEDQEMLFVLLARDPAAPTVVRAWVEERIRLGLNRRTDPQIQEALGCAENMEHQRIRASIYMPHWAERKRLEAEQARERR